MAAPLPLSSPSVMADNHPVIEGGKAITVRLACIDAPELAQAPLMANQARNYPAEPRLKIGSKVQPPFSDAWIAMGRNRGRKVIRGGQLNRRWWKNGMAFAYLKVPRPMRQKAYLDWPRIQGQPAPLNGRVAVAWRNHPGPGTFERSRRIIANLPADSRSFLLAAANRCRVRPLLCRAQEPAASLEMERLAAFHCTGIFLPLCYVGSILLYIDLALTGI